MNYKELLVAIDKAKRIYGFVQLSENEGEYFLLDKANARNIIDKEEWWLAKEDKIDAFFYKGVLKIG